MSVPHLVLMPFRMELSKMPDYWRKRAEESRAIADDMTDHRSRRIMLNLANQYDELAVRAEHRLGRDKKSAAS